MKNPATFRSPFEIGDLVTIDGDKSIKARVSGCLFRFDGVTIEVAWFNNGEARAAWFALFRLEAAEE